MYLSLLRPRVSIRPGLYLEAKLHYKLRLLRILNSDPIKVAAIERYSDIQHKPLFLGRELSLDEYFAQAAPRLTIAEINTFWVKLLDIVNSVAKIHSLRNPGENSSGQRHSR